MYKEKQRFRQSWVWLLVMPLIGLFSFGLIRQFALDKPFGENPTVDLTVMAVSIVCIALALAFLKIKLTIKIDLKGVKYKFYPFYKKYNFLPWDEIEKAYVRQYIPINEFGGYGLRVNGNQKSLTVAGNYGLQLELKNGNKILLGTQKPAQIENFLKDNTAVLIK